MNKKAQGEFLLVIVLIMFLLWFGASSIPTEHDDCMNDCKDIFADDFTFESLCEDWFNESIVYECKKTNRTKLKEYCFNKCTVIIQDTQNRSNSK